MVTKENKLIGLHIIVAVSLRDRRSLPIAPKIHHLVGKEYSLFRDLK